MARHPKGEMRNMGKSREEFGVVAGDEIFVQGNVSYARIAAPIGENNAEELAKENKRRQDRGISAMDRPFFSISITEPVIIKGQGTALAQFHESKYYASKPKDGSAPKQTLSLESKSKRPIEMFCQNENGEYAPMANPGKNPAIGQKVVLRIRAYGGKTPTSRMGSTFESVAFQNQAKDIQFYTGGSSAAALEGFGSALNTGISNEVQTVPGAAQPSQDAQGGFAQQAPAAPAAPSAPAGGGFGLDPNAPAEPAANPFGGGSGNGNNANPFA